MSNLYIDFKWAITVGIFCLVVLIAVGVLLCIVALFRRSIPSPSLPHPL
uniref:Putative P5 n=1 Tax=Manihot esculenta associated ampelovirus 2 TaxID=2843332 RepID=A0A8F0FSN9_9CLOS|nr:putative P5 [Manihot esculenta associated ampelovirus 2]QWK51507.1 putative P5 [Manihot esculenta associated ampelovirus 2]QWK51514.1 putative P5 [Manihot esculenta associated ampelovirus 2]QWK51521.1 putative P5 [Manihot esculenta associated ampelovirus 2]QWK51527.1 putative P5 [Manihot esculenta associated ampelovirus 2]